MTVETTRHARCCSLVVNRAETIGMSGRRQRPGGDELEDQVRDAEGREERVELGGAKRVRDDDDPDVAEDARDEECARDDESGAGEGAGRAHGVVVATRPRVRLPIGRPEPRRRHVGVDLRRREALVTEQLLDDAQVRAAVEQVRRERVAQGVGRDAVRQARAPAQPVQPVAQAADAERLAVVVEEDLGRRAASPDRSSQERRPAVLEVGGHRGPGRAPEQPDPLLASLAEDANLTASQVERAEVRLGQLADPQARGVGRLDEGPVAQRQGGRQGDPVGRTRAARPWRGRRSRRRGAPRCRRSRGRVAAGPAGAASRSLPTGRPAPGRHGRPSGGRSGSPRGAGPPMIVPDPSRAPRGTPAGRPDRASASRRRGPRASRGRRRSRSRTSAGCAREASRAARVWRKRARAEGVARSRATPLTRRRPARRAGSAGSHPGRSSVPDHGHGPPPRPDPPAPPRPDTRRSGEGRRIRRPARIPLAGHDGVGCRLDRRRRRPGRWPPRPCGRSGRRRRRAGRRAARSWSCSRTSGSWSTPRRRSRSAVRDAGRGGRRRSSGSSTSNGSGSGGGGPSRLM